MVTIRFADYMRRELPGGCVDRPHGSGDYLFLYFPYPMKLTIESGSVTTKNNACVLFAPYDMHCFSGAPDFLNSFVHFKPDFPVTVKTGCVFYPDNYGEINETLKRIAKEAVMPDELSARMREALIRELLVLTARGQKNEQGDPLYKKFYDLKMKMLKDMTFMAMGAGAVLAYQKYSKPMMKKMNQVMKSAKKQASETLEDMI